MKDIFTDMPVIIAIESFVIVALICALLAGQPASAEADRALIAVQSTQIAAHPTPTKAPLPGCTFNTALYYLNRCP